MKRGNLRFSEEAYRELQQRTRWQSAAEVVDTEAPSKYRNKKTNGYASKKEAARAEQLHLLERTGQIRNLREQVPFLLIPAYRNADGSTLERAAHYVADFTYEEGPSFNPVVEDCKGMRTTEYVLKRKLMLMVHGIKIKET